VEAQEESQDCTINTLGFGSNHNSDLIEKLSERFDGMYYFIKDNDAINECFATCLGGLMSTVATNLHLKLTPQNGAKNIQILNDLLWKRQQNAVTGNLGDIQSEEKRHILFEMDLPEIKTEYGAESYCSVKLSYENTIAKKTDVLLSLMELKREKVTAKCDYTVDEQYNRVLATQALQNAEKLGKAGQLGQARASLDRAMTSVRSSRSSYRAMSRTLVSDMAATRRGYATPREYQRWGKQCSKMNSLSYRRERSVRLSNRAGPYATQSQYVNVSKAKTVSQFNMSCSDDSDSPEEVHFKHRTRSVSMRSMKAPKSKQWKPRRSRASRDQVRTPIASSRRRRPKSKTVQHQSSQYVNFEDLTQNVKKKPSKVSKPEPPKSSAVSQLGAQACPDSIPIASVIPGIKPESHIDSGVKAAKPATVDLDKKSSNGQESLPSQATNLNTDTKQNEEMKDSQSI
jgi:hypothetical protein